MMVMEQSLWVALAKQYRPHMGTPDTPDTPDTVAQMTSSEKACER